MFISKRICCIEKVLYDTPILYKIKCYASHHQKSLAVAQNQVYTIIFLFASVPITFDRGREE